MWSIVDYFYDYHNNSEDDSESEDHPVARRQIRNNWSLDSLSDNECIKLFRLNKEAVWYLIKATEKEFKVSFRDSAVTPMLKVCASLRFLATGSYQLCVGNDMNIGLSQPMISNVLSDFLDIMENKICPLWINAAMNSHEQQDAKRTFYERSGIPGIILAIDGTQIAIIAPKEDIRTVYYNRKGFYSLNVLIACDHQSVIRFVDARYAGSNHDSLIWSLSALRPYMLNRYADGERNTMLIGDAGFPQEEIMLVPYRNAAAGSSEALFNHRHSKARSIVERTIGLLKMRFRCLHRARELHYTPAKATQIVNACVALHNICLAYKVEDTLEEDQQTTEDGTEPFNGEVADRAIDIRNRIRDSLYESR